MTYLVSCRRCGAQVDGNYADSLPRHEATHGREPRGWAPGGMGPGHPGEPFGTRVRVINPHVGLPVGTILTVVDTSPEHHSANGGGYDIRVAQSDVSIWSRWLEVVE